MVQVCRVWEGVNCDAKPLAASNEVRVMMQQVQQVQQDRSR